MKFTTFSFATLVGLGSMAATVPAIAQHAGPQVGDAQRPAPVAASADGQIARFIVGPMGHVRGFVLDSGTLVMTGGREDEATATLLAVGNAVHVAGFGLPGMPLTIMHATVSVNGQVVIAPREHGQHGGGARGAWQSLSPADRMARFEAHSQQRDARIAQLPAVTTSGTVQLVLAGPRGGAHGVLLSNGASVFFPRPIAEAIRARGGLHSGESLHVVGHGGNYPQGTSVFAQRLTFSDGSTAAMQ